MPMYISLVIRKHPKALLNTGARWVRQWPARLAMQVQIPLEVYVIMANTQPVIITITITILLKGL